MSWVLGSIGEPAGRRAAALAAAFSDGGRPVTHRPLDEPADEALRAERVTLVLEPAAPGLGDSPFPPLAVLKRGDARDALLVGPEHLAIVAAELAADPGAFNPADPLRSVRTGARLATDGSLRMTQVARLRPDLALEPMPSLSEALDRLDDSLDALVVPGHVADEVDPALVRRHLDPPWLGSPGDGVFWLRGPWREDLREALLPLDDKPSRVEVTAELALADTLGAEGLGARARARHARLEMHALVLDGERMTTVHRTGEATVRGALRLAMIVSRELAEAHGLTLPEVAS